MERAYLVAGLFFSALVVLTVRELVKGPDSLAEQDVLLARRDARKRKAGEVPVVKKAKALGRLGEYQRIQRRG